ncbi:hippurate hydrolase [Amycolatopsis pretoriensis]|uniref:Hippurate hydrolase n=1 Tax=Amycolatopsis pretoriensis TaxID=218821 RepID=A0A1H5RK74_9PSEU|nr:M20 family metallopeptidase [Amycolatopsis pretoriensis]SEF38494.1 hippurate hydrolase [Amycolatopsis pretoriensis]
MTLLDEAHGMRQEVVRLRRLLHSRPELGLHLPHTQQAVLAALDGLPLEISTGKATTSVTAVLRGGAPPSGQRPVLLRADMDAVPVDEETGLAYASSVPGAAHACGHDLHTAMLVGAARLLAGRRAELAGDVILMFQPGEEGWEGARAMLEEGVLDAAGERAGVAYALHVFSTLPQGFHLRPGVVLASSSALDVTVSGRGGHASTPHLARDPVPATAEMITALQALVTRRVDVFDPAVLTVGVVQAGTRRNVIPPTARFEATLRTFTDATAARIGAEARLLVEGIAAAHGLEVDVRFDRERPATVNDPGEAAVAGRTIAEVFGTNSVHRLEHPFTGSEDFSRVLAEVPGAFIALGALPKGADPGTAPFNHSGRAVFDEAVLPQGAALLAELALRRSHTATPTDLAECPR